MTSTAPPPDPGNPVIVAAFRTPIGTSGRSLKALPAADLLSRLLARLAGIVGGPHAGGIDDVIVGNVMGPGGNVARYAALAAGINIPGVTIDRQCASGLAAIDLAATQVRAAGSRAVVLAGGVESASTAPWRFWPPTGPEAEPERYLRAPFAPPEYGDPDMALAADRLASDRGVTREASDEYAARSHARAVAAAAAGRFHAELIPLAGLDHDERPRPNLTMRRLARFHPLPGLHTVTAGNSCGVNDGAAAVAVVDGARHARLGARGLEVLASAVAAGESALPGQALVPAVELALARAGLGLDAVDRIEFNEAFAGQILACCLDLGLDPERVCPDGGALALGHPWGASGAVLMVRLFHSLAPGQVGLAAIAAGGGQGVAMVVRAVAP